MGAALLVSSLLVVGAPFLGEGRRWLAANLPGQYLWIVNGVVALAALCVLAAAVRRIRVGFARARG